MAAICGGRPSRWVIGQREVPAIAICEWYVGPGHGGQGLGKGMMRHFAAGDRFLYGFSLSRAAVVNFARLGWVGPWRVSLLALPFPRLAKIPTALFSLRPRLELHDHMVANGQLPAALCADLDSIESAAPSPARMKRDSAEWSWRLSFHPDRSYHICVAHRAGQPTGYVAVRRLTPGKSRLLGKADGALIVDLVASFDDDQTLRALTDRAVAIAAAMKTRVVLAATTHANHRRALSSRGFISSGFPIVGRRLQNAAPQFMWSPEGPGAEVNQNSISFTFADSDVDMNL